MSLPKFHCSNLQHQDGVINHDVLNHNYHRILSHHDFQNSLQDSLITQNLLPDVDDQGYSRHVDSQKIDYKLNQHTNSYDISNAHTPSSRNSHADSPPYEEEGSSNTSISDKIAPLEIDQHFSKPDTLFPEYTYHPHSHRLPNQCQQVSSQTHHKIHTHIGPSFTLNDPSDQYMSDVLYTMPHEDVRNIPQDYQLIAYQAAAYTIQLAKQQENEIDFSEDVSHQNFTLRPEHKLHRLPAKYNLAAPSIAQSGPLMTSMFPQAIQNFSGELQLPPPPPPPPPSQSQESTQSPDDEPACKRKPTEKRKAHNAVEKRYRNSINDRINDLKDLLPEAMLTSSIAKASKAAILQKSIEYIHHLHREQEHLLLYTFSLADHIEHTENKRPLIVGTDGQPLDRPKGKASVIIFQNDSAESKKLSPKTQSKGVLSKENSLSTTLLAEEEASKSTSGHSNMSDASPSPESHAQSPGTSPSPESLVAEDKPKLQLVPSPGTTSDATRLLMCALLVCLFIIVPSGTAPSSHNRVQQSNGGSRILTATSIGNTEIFTWDQFVWWIIRIGTVIISLFAVFAKEPVDDAQCGFIRVAKENQKKCQALTTMRHLASARWHAVKALESLGQRPAETRIERLIGLAWQTTRQILHLIRIGRWLDRYFTSHRRDGQACAEITALSNFYLHQLSTQVCQSQKHNLVAVSSQQALFALQSVNSADSTYRQIDAMSLARIYFAATLQCYIAGTDILGHLFFSRACSVIKNIPSSQKAALLWILQPAAHHFIEEKLWINKEVNSQNITYLPGNIHHATILFCRNRFHAALTSLLASQDTEDSQQCIDDMYDCALHNDLIVERWWSLMVKVMLAWRRGSYRTAQALILEADDLVMKRDEVQNLFYIVIRAQQALIDSSHVLCLHSLHQASKHVSTFIDSKSPQSYQPAVISLVTILSYRYILSTRVALYRICNFWKNDQTDSKLQEIYGFANLLSMRNEIIKDIGKLQSISETNALALPTALLYRATLRHLTGARVVPTQRLFSQSIRTAQRFGLPFDEGLALLHMCSALRDTLSSTELKTKLERAVCIFERLGAEDELVCARKLLTSLTFTYLPGTTLNDE